MVQRHSLESARRDPGEIPAANAERRADGELSVFEWYCPACDEWLGWPQNPDHSAKRCDDSAACSHGDEDACGHVVCGECQTLADSHEWVLDGETAGEVAREVFDDDPDIETAVRRALLEDLQRVTDGQNVEEIVDDRRELFEQYVQTVADEGDDDEQYTGGRKP